MTILPTRTILLLLAVIVCLPAAATPAPPPDAFTVLPVAPDGPRITPYLAYQVGMAWRQDETRRQRFAAIRTEGELRRLQHELRDSLLAMLGGLPATRTPLNPQITGRIQMTGFHIEKLVFESVPGLFVTALVYVPDGPTGPRPAVLVACGHSANGKAYYQALCQRLVARGYIVICWDPVGQGERSQFWDASAGRSRYNLICGEHAVLGNLAYLAGASLARWEVWDGMRALDYLLTRPDVDAARISITGTSGGGFQAALIGALDTRIHAIAPSCYITALPMRVANRIFEDPDSDPEQDPYRLIAGGVDHAGLLLLMYPRPVFVAAAVLDFFPIEGTRRSLREIAAVYSRFGHADRLGSTEGYHKHAFSTENQAAALTFLDRFNGLPPLRTGVDTRDVDEATLRTTKTGQVVLDHPEGRVLTDEIRDYYRARRPAHPVALSTMYFGAGYAGVRLWPVRQYDGSEAHAGQVRWEAAGRSSIDDVVVDKYVLHHSGGLLMPVLYLHRRGSPSSKTLIWIGANGKVGAGDWDAVRAYLDEGYAIVSFDGRGLGETRMRYTAASVDDPTLALKEFDRAYVNPLSSVLADYVYNALLTGRPYWLQLIEDAEIAARFARLHLGATDLAITGADDGFTLAHDAASVLTDIRLVPRDNSRALAWSEIVETRRELWPVQFVLPGGAYVR